MRETRAVEENYDDYSFNEEPSVILEKPPKVVNAPIYQAPPPPPPPAFKEPDRGDTGSRSQLRMSMPQNEPQFTSDKDLNESLPEAYSSKPPIPVIG
jgi:hypothetical protein